VTLISLDLEVLGYHQLNEKDKNDFHRLFERTEIYPVSSTIIELAIGLRQQRKISLGDAIIAATALEYRQTLITRNVKDFDWVDGLKVLDPFDEL
jgi:toxin FitB